MKKHQKLFEMIPIFFLIIIIQLCIKWIKKILHINCRVLHMTPNMANITQ